MIRKEKIKAGDIIRFLDLNYYFSFGIVLDLPSKCDARIFVLDSEEEIYFIRRKLNKIEKIWTNDDIKQK